MKITNKPLFKHSLKHINNKNQLTDITDKNENDHDDDNDKSELSIQDNNYNVNIENSELSNNCMYIKDNTLIIDLNDENENEELPLNLPISKMKSEENVIKNNSFEISADDNFNSTNNNHGVDYKIEDFSKRIYKKSSVIDKMSLIQKRKFDKNNKINSDFWDDSTTHHSEYEDLTKKVNSNNSNNEWTLPKKENLTKKQKAILHSKKLYQEGIDKMKQVRKEYKKNEKKKEIKELSQCTFHPQISKYTNKYNHVNSRLLHYNKKEHQKKIRQKSEIIQSDDCKLTTISEMINSNSNQYSKIIKINPEKVFRYVELEKDTSVREYFKRMKTSRNERKRILERSLDSDYFKNGCNLSNISYINHNSKHYNSLNQSLDGYSSIEMSYYMNNGRNKILNYSVFDIKKQVDEEYERNESCNDNENQNYSKEIYKKASLSLHDSQSKLLNMGVYEKIGVSKKITNSIFKIIKNKLHERINDTIENS